VRGERLEEREERLFVPALRVQVLGKDLRSTKLRERARRLLVSVANSRCSFSRVFLSFSSPERSELSTTLFLSALHSSYSPPRARRAFCCSMPGVFLFGVLSASLREVIVEDQLFVFAIKGWSYSKHMVPGVDVYQRAAVDEDQFFGHQGRSPVEIFSVSEAVVASEYSGEFEGLYRAIGIQMEEEGFDIRDATISEESVDVVKRIEQETRMVFIFENNCHREFRAVFLFLNEDVDYAVLEVIFRHREDRKNDILCHCQNRDS